MLADLWPNIPANPTWVFVVCLAIVVGYLLLRAYTGNQQIQINGLRESLDSQAERHSREMSDLNAKVERLDARLEEARTERHKLRGENAKLVLALNIVRTLHESCTCGALEPVAAVLPNLVTEA